LFDEPLSNLDAKLRVHMRAEIGKIHKRLGATTIYVTHDQVEAMTLADRIVVMEKGFIQQVGTPLEVFEKPQNLFVAGFIGSPTMNFLHCHYEGGAHLTGQGFEIPLLPEQLERTRDHVGNMVLGVRPSHVQVSRPAAEPPPPGTIRGTIEVKEPLGTETHLFVAWNQDALCAKADAHTDLQVGEAVILSPDLDHAHLFEERTGKAIF
jgi:multiple sugar transport system ATP-binding protein